MRRAWGTCLLGWCLEIGEVFGGGLHWEGERFGK
jgi:hypothetical protein